MTNIITKCIIDMNLTKEQIQAIERTLKKGNRVEIIPTKDGVKLIEHKVQVIKYSAL